MILHYDSNMASSIWNYTFAYLISALIKVHVFINLSICNKKKWSNADHIVYFAHSLIDKKDPKTRNKGCRNIIKQYLFNRLLKPVLVRNVYESVHDGTEALVFP